jgi:hypothetical protein
MKSAEVWMAQNQDGKCNLFNEKPVCVLGFYFYDPLYRYNDLPLFIGEEIMGEGQKEPVKIIIKVT